MYVLRTCAADMTAYEGFRWPESGPVSAPDWDPRPECGGGLHGLAWGVGDGDLLDWSPDARWLVVEVPDGTTVDLTRKVKFPSGTVVYCGDRLGAVAAIVAYGADPTQVAGGTATAGDWGTATAGDWGTATAGDWGTATAGDWGTATAGDRGTATAGDRGTATAGDRGTATVRNPTAAGQAIATRYLGPTNTRGARISARAWGGRLTTPYDPRLDSYENHARAAMALADRFGWGGKWQAGVLPDSDHVFIRIERESTP